MNQAVHVSLHIYVQGSQVLSLIDTSHLPSYLKMYVHRIWLVKVYSKQITSGELGTGPGLGIMAEKNFTSMYYILSVYKANRFRS